LNARSSIFSAPRAPQFDYTYDTIGNLRYRSDDLQGVFEYSCYDALNRLQYYAAGNHATACQTPGTGGTAKTVVYDAFGNITSKSDVGTYAYAAAGGTRPHGVKGVTGSLNGVTNPYFYYDPNGNMACESTSAATTYTACASAVKTVSWTAFNMVAQMAQATTTIAFSYDSDRSRIKQVCTGPSCVTATTYYLNDPASGAMSEKAVAGATTTWRDYLSVDGKIIAERFLPVGGASSWKFFVLDHLGSIAVVADSAGTVSENLAYDAWGRRRSATDGSDLSQCTVTSVTTRGFINQEQMDGGVCLDNLNARIYDPTLGRFLSADPMIGDPYTPQQLNRYTYSLNNPLSLSDPNGLCFLGCFYRNPVVQTVIAIAIAALVPYAFPEEWAAFGAEVGIGTLATEAVAVAAGGALSGAATAGMNGGNILRGMLSGAFEALAFFRVGGYVDGLEAADATAADIPNALLRIGLHGLVGGIASSINKGNFGAGFLAAGFGAASDAVPTNGIAEGAIVHAVAGGVGSILGGGKFENGAQTAGFGYLFDAALEPTHGQSSGSSIVQDALRDDYYARTYVSFWGDIKTDYTDDYYKLDPISRASVQVHEGVHVDQLRPFVVGGCPWGCFAMQRAELSYGGSNAMELQAFDAQVRFLDKRLAGVPQSNRTIDYWKAVDFRDQQMRNLSNAREYQHPTGSNQ
jgi:RHS repeat-associated protein